MDSHTINNTKFEFTYPTLDKIRTDLKGFSEDIQMFTYHLLNGRINESESYRLAILNEQTQISNAFKKNDPVAVNEIYIDELQNKTE